ncbi:MAG: N-acetyl sugar amidotransferase [Desulfovibrionaceae bacterium]
MEYCKRCVYPANARPGILFDEEGVCSGCRLIEKRLNMDFRVREKELVELLREYQARQREKGNPFDCIIPVSGGKDSTYQTWLVKEKYGLNPLCVCYNHTFNTALGLRNLENLIQRLDVNLVRFTTAPGSAVRMAKHMLKLVGDITWHYHAGIMTFPIRAAVMYDVPLVVWGEEGFSDLVGMYDQDDMVEFTKKKRQEHSMRGFEPEDLLAAPDCPLTAYDLAPFFYPTDEQLEQVGVRGIYLSNFIRWDNYAQTRFVIENLGFETAQARERTPNIYAKLDDIHANGTHDYLKYLKFGYGRATDDVSTDIRYGRMTREEGIDYVARMDPVRPRDLDIFLRAAGMTEQELLDLVEPMRDPAIWRRNEAGVWEVRDSVANHRHDPGVDAARMPLNPDTPPILPTEERVSSHCRQLDEQTEYVVL